MSIHEIVTIALSIFAGFFCGQAMGYRQANREYKQAVDGDMEAMAKERIVEMKHRREGGVA